MEFYLEKKIEGIVNTDDIVQRDLFIEVEREACRPQRYDGCLGGVFREYGRNRLSNLHVRGRESCSLSLKSSLCQTVGWKPAL